ncbi:MAG: hypothetical protein V2A79_04995 [Planctomycetota bacterium]
MEPRAVNFGLISRKASAQQQKVTITRGDGGPLNLKLAPVDLANFEAQLREIEPGERYELEVTLSPPFLAERMRTNLTLETGIAEAPTTTLPVFGSIAPRVSAEPSRVTLPPKLDSDWEQAVHLVWDDDLAHKILGATANDEGLVVRVEEQGDQQQVVLQVPPTYKPRPGVSMVTIKTDDTEMPEVQVPIGPSRPAKPPRSATRATKPPRLKGAQTTQPARGAEGVGVMPELPRVSASD